MGTAGSKGDKGDTGIQGPQGSKGEKGEKGESGTVTLDTITASQMTQLLNVLASDSGQRFKGPKGEKGDTGATGDTGAVGATGARGSDGTFNTESPYTFNKQITFNQPIVIRKPPNTNPIQYIGEVNGSQGFNNVPYKKKDGTISNYAMLELDQDKNNSGDFVMFSSISESKGTNLNLQPQDWAGNVRIGYNPNNYQDNGVKTPPDSKLAVYGNISSFNLGNVGKLKFIQERTCLYDKLIGTSNKPFGDCGNATIFNISDGKLISYIDNNNKLKCLSSSEDKSKLITTDCDFSKKQQFFSRVGTGLYNEYSDKCIDSAQVNGFGGCNGNQWQTHFISNN
jgi:hypothetical protein